MPFLGGDGSWEREGGREGAYSCNGEIQHKKGAERESKRVRRKREGGVSKKVRVQKEGWMDEGEAELEGREGEERARERE